MHDNGIRNETPYAVERLLLLDPQGRDLLTVLIQAVFRIEGRDTLLPSDERKPIPLGGTWNGEPGKSSYRLEPQIAPRKLASDVALLGHAYPFRRGDTRVDVGLKVGPVSKVVRVHGDRRWRKALGSIPLAAPFEKIPLVYERAYGGWDRRHPEASRHRCERRNPLGMGYCRGDWEDGWQLPNLEDPARPLRSASDAPPPAGFGFIGPDWLPRADYAGTYDGKWMETKMPLLPDDFHPRFYNAAHPDLVAPAYLRGDEPVIVVGASPRGRLAFDLPGLPPPSAEMDGGSGRRVPIPASLDEVVIDTDAHEVLLQWRGCVALTGGIRSLGEVVVRETAKSMAKA